MLVAVRWATMAGDQVGELNLRTANAAVLAPASTSVAGNVRPTVQVSNDTPSFVRDVVVAIDGLRRVEVRGREIRVVAGRGQRRDVPPHAHVSERQAHRSEEHTSELQSLAYLVCRLLLE